MSRKLKTSSQKDSEALLPEGISSEEMEAALRNIQATNEARKEDPTVLHVQAVEPIYPSPQFIEEYHRQVNQAIIELEKLMEATEDGSDFSGSARLVVGNRYAPK